MYKRVMIVDDNEVDRYIGTRNITKYYFSEEVIEMPSAKRALEYLESLASVPEQLPQLIFLDIRMPDLDGFGFLEAYEKLPEAVQKNCIIMMLTTSLSPLDHERAKNNKFVAKFLNKPLDKEKLTELNNSTDLPGK